MINTSLPLRPIPTAIVCALLALAGNLAAAILPAEKLLPDDTLIVLGTPDYPGLREFYLTSTQTRFLNDPAMKPFTDKLLAKVREEWVQPLEHDLGVKFDDYAGLPQGQLTFAIIQNGWQGSADPLPAAVFLMDTKGRSGQLKTNLADLRHKWVDAGKTIKSEKIRDLEFTTYLLSDKDVPPSFKKILAPGSDDSANESSTNAPLTLLVGQYESLLIAGTSAKVVEKIVAHLTGGSAPALADVPAFETSRLALFREAPLYGWANLKTVTDLLLHQPTKDADPASPFAMFAPDKIINALGLGGLKTIAFASQNSADGSLAQISVSAPEADRQGLLKLLPADGKESSPPPFVPADVIKFQRSRVDNQKAWAALQKMLGDISPQILSGLNFALDTANTAAKQKDPGFDLQKNLFGNLGDDFISYSKPPRGSTLAELNAAPSLFLLSSPRPEQLADALKSILVLANATGAAPAEREFLGRKIYSLALPMLTLGADGKGVPTLSYAASSSYLAITTDTAMLEEYLRSSETQQKNLREKAGLVDAAQKIGGSSIGIFGYQNNLQVSRFMFEAARKSQGTNSADSATLPGMDFGGSFKDWMDFSLFPPFEQVSKYFYFSVYGLSVNAEGFNLKMFSPVPPELKK